MFSHMQSALTIAITFSMVVFALAVLADGRGVRILRWLVQYANARATIRSLETASEPRIPVVRPVAVRKPPIARPATYGPVVVTVHSAALKPKQDQKQPMAVKAIGDTREFELTRQ